MGTAIFSVIKLAFFDVDGTLIHRNYSGSPSLKTRAFNFATENVFGLKGFDYAKILGRRIFGLTDRSIIKTALSHLGMSKDDYHEKEDQLFLTIDKFFEEHMANEKNAGYSPVSGAIGFLVMLRSENIRLGLATGNIKKHALWKLQICGFDNFFSTGGFGDDAELRTDILKAAIARNSDIAVNNICHFGDSPADLLAARDCGIKAVGLSNKGGGTHTREELAETNYGLIIDNWAEKTSIANYLST